MVCKLPSVGKHVLTSRLIILIHKKEMGSNQKKQEYKKKIFCRII